ncbi:outer membrane porin, OprD family [bacterium]|nr:MAG: outer membrane porin, OprD family [bacterium]
MMQSLRIVALFVYLFFPVILFAQHQEVSEDPDLWRGHKMEAEDSTALIHAFKTGKVSGHFRHMIMATQNEGDLTDYFAFASGGGIRYETNRFYGFNVIVSGFFIFNNYSTDLGKRDPQTNAINRYEIGLFDIEDPHNTSDIDRLEELLVEYTTEHSKTTFGKQLVNTPFINLQDGRMRPTGVEGIWHEQKAGAHSFQLGWLYYMSPRSTTEWYGVGESIGLFPTGKNPDGTVSEYEGNLESKGIAVANWNYTGVKHLKVDVWNYWVENIINTGMVQLEYSIPTHSGSTWLTGLQITRQDAINHGGNEDEAKTYIEKGAHSWVLSTRLGYKTQRWNSSLNYTRITADGRFVFPREWGREPFYTFLPRERNEGAGDVHAVVAKTMYKPKESHWDTELALGYYHLPDVTDTELNKYGLPSYWQTYVDASYHFEGFLKGTEVHFMWVSKWNAGEANINLSSIINKVNMNHFSVIVNYHF